MKISELTTDNAILAEMGSRLMRRRVELNLTQAELAQQAGVSKRTVERIEAGYSAQSETLLRVFRVLELLPGLDQLLPEPSLSPIAQLQQAGKTRQRVRRAEQESVVDKPWSWGEDQ